MDAHELERQNSGGRYSGGIAVPLCLVMAGTLLMMDRFAIIHITRLLSLWPGLLIAMGVEELYKWAQSKEGR